MKKIVISLLQISFHFGGLQSQVTNVPITASESYKGEYAQGTMRIIYAKGNHLTKPFIVVEGFDPGNITCPEERFGRRSVEDFMRSIDADSADLSESLLGDISSYDIIYVDFNRGSDYIQRNALLLEEIIRYVNANKLPVDDERQSNIILGKSMGSIIIRVALRRMENNYTVCKERHDTRLYISMDGGQQGSNVPMGFQYMANHFRNLYISTGSTAIRIEKISMVRKSTSPLAKMLVSETPAARQLTINHINAQNQLDNSMHEEWQSELQAIGYPAGDGVTAFRSIALSNGSGNGKQQKVGHAGNLLGWKGRAHTSLLCDMAGLSGLLMCSIQKVDARGFPLWFTLGTLPGRNEFVVDISVNAKAENCSNELYNAKISYRKKILGIIPIEVVLAEETKSAPASVPAYDHYPGGYQNISDDMAFGRVASGPLLKAKVTLKSSPACHVPVVSALDIGEGFEVLSYDDYFKNYSSENAATDEKKSPFDEFYVAVENNAENQPHATIAPAGGEWLVAQTNPRPNPSVANSLASEAFQQEQQFLIRTSFSSLRMAQDVNNQMIKLSKQYWVNYMNAAGNPTIRLIVKSKPDGRLRYKKGATITAWNVSRSKAGKLSFPFFKKNRRVAGWDNMKTYNVTASSMDVSKIKLFENMLIGQGNLPSLAK